MDITQYLDSISLMWESIGINTKKPIIITELSNISWEIELLYKKRLLKLGIKLKDMKLKFY